MNGLVILFDPSFSLEVAKGDSTEPTEVCFAQLFSPILDFVARLYWITLHCASSPFQNAMAGIEAFDLVDGLRIEVEGVDPDLGIQLWRPPTLADLAEHVRNDYQDFFGVKRDRDPLEVTRRFAELDERSDFGSSGWKIAFAAAIEEETEVVFFSHDEEVWEVYAADSHLLDAVLSRQ